MTDMDALEALMGEWTTEVRHPNPDIGVVHGGMTVEWLDGGGYLVQRSWTEDARFPRWLSLIGPTEAGDRIVQHYFDSRGVARIYEISLEGGVWRQWRDDPEMSQRFTGRFSDDGSEIEMRLERTEPDGTWIHDFDLVYHRKA
jgi:hypothetical protein